MKNKNVGFLIMGVSFIIGLIVIIFNNALKSITSRSCTHGSMCSMWGTISTESYISLSLAGLVFVIGLFLMFAKENKMEIIKKISSPVKQEYNAKPAPEKLNEETLKELDKEEKKIIDLILKENGAMFQSDIIDKSGFHKVKVTRILDYLEGKRLISRKRRGLSNVIILNRTR